MCIVVHQNLQDEVLDERDGVRCLLFQIQEPVDVVDQVFGAHSIELSEKCFEVAVYGIDTLDINPRVFLVYMVRTKVSPQSLQR